MKWILILLLGVNSAWSNLLDAPTLYQSFSEKLPKIRSSKNCLILDRRYFENKEEKTETIHLEFQDTTKPYDFLKGNPYFISLKNKGPIVFEGETHVATFVETSDPIQKSTTYTASGFTLESVNSEKYLIRSKIILTVSTETNELINISSDYATRKNRFFSKKRYWKEYREFQCR